MHGLQSRLRAGRGVEDAQASRDQRACGDGYQPTQCRASAARHNLAEPSAQTPTVAEGSADQTIVAIQLDQVARALKHRGAAFALPEVLLHRHPQPGIDVILQIIGDLRPNSLTGDYHGLFPF